jgi:hypothetical protein
MANLMCLHHKYVLLHNFAELCQIFQKHLSFTPTSDTMKSGRKVTRIYGMEFSSTLPGVTVSAVNVKTHKGKRRQPNITISQESFMGAPSNWDSMPEAENIWTPNLDSTEETVHIVQSKRKGGKVGAFH